MKKEKKNYVPSVFVIASAPVPCAPASGCYPINCILYSLDMI